MGCFQKKCLIICEKKKIITNLCRLCKASAKNVCMELTEKRAPSLPSSLPHQLALLERGLLHQHLADSEMTGRSHWPAPKLAYFTKANAWGREAHLVKKKTRKHILEWKEK